MNFKFDYKTIIILVTIIILSLSLTGNFFLKDYFVEPDSYYHVRMIEYLIKNGYVPEYDPQSYYYLEESKVKRLTLLWPIAAINYNLIYGDEYEKHWLIFSAQFLSLIFNIILIILSYFLGKELFSKRAGYITALLVGVLPALTFKMQTRIFENDIFGLISIVFGLIFLSKAFKENNKQKKLLFFVISAISLGLTSWIWDGYAILLIVLIPSIGLILFLISIKKEKKIFKEIFLFILIILFLTILSGANFVNLVKATIIHAGIDINNFFEINLFSVLLIGTFLIFFSVLLGFLLSNISDNNKKIIFLIPFYLSLIFLLTIFFMGPTISPEDPLIFISEKRFGLNYLLYSLNIFIVFAITFLIFSPLTFFDSKDYTKIILFCFLVFSFLISFLIIKYVFIFSLITAIISGFLVEKILNFKGKIFFLEKKQIILISILFFLMGFMLLNILPVDTTTPKSRIEVVNAFSWIDENTPVDSNILVWWSYGHKASFFSNRKITNDNLLLGGYGSIMNRKSAEFFVTNDLLNAKNIAKNYFNANYVFIDSEMFFSLRQMNSVKNQAVDNSDKFLGNQKIDCRKLSCIDLIESFNLNINYEWVDTNDIVLYESKEVFFKLNPNVNSTAMAKIYFNSEESKEFFEEVFSIGSIKIFKIK